MVLVVDDDPAVLSLVAAIVTRGGYCVLTALNGPSALSLAAERHIDVLLTDLMMTGMGGLELIRSARAMGIGRVVAMSGWTAAELERGIQFLAKPFTPTQLLRKLEEAIAA